MRKLIALIALALATPALAQTNPPANVPMANGTNRAVTPTASFCYSAPDWVPCTSGGGGGGGGGDASAANQSTQITAANLTNTVLGAVTASPTANTISDRLKVINTTLGTPFQAGGSIGNTSFGATQSGTWNVTNISGTVSLPTGAATAAKQDTLLAALGTPVQTGGKVDTVIVATSTDKGASIGTSATTLIASNGSRRGYSIQNQSTTATCYVSNIATATADFHSLQIGPGGFYESSSVNIGTGAVSIICSAASTPIYAREF